jgi:putative oxidoreductase
MVDIRDHVAGTNQAVSITVFVGKVCLTLIFFLNGLGVIDQSHAAHEMVAYGIPQGIVPAAIWGGRILQSIAGAVLLWRSDWIAALACVALIAFLIPATIIGHSFWSAPPDAYGAQLVNFLKNLAMIGGLLTVGALYWRSP